jgi:hypothetical protein
MWGCCDRDAMRRQQLLRSSRRTADAGMGLGRVSTVLSRENGEQRVFTNHRMWSYLF